MTVFDAECLMFEVPNQLLYINHSFPFPLHDPWEYDNISFQMLQYVSYNLSSVSNSHLHIQQETLSEPSVVLASS